MDSNTVKEKYDSTAQQYIQLEESHYQMTCHSAAASKYLKSHAVDVVIDVGCGSGAVIRRLAAEYPNVKFVGIDISPELVKIGKVKYCSKNIEFVVADFSIDHQKIIDKYKLKSKHVLFLVLGPMEHYHSDDKFTQAVANTWGMIKDGGFVNLFLNQDVIGRRFVMGKGKKYWTARDALHTYSGEKDRVHLKYYSFFLLDVIRARTTIGDMILVLIDRLLMNAPASLAKKIAVAFEILIERGGQVEILHEKKRSPDMSGC
ncbi:MAG: class I SAM-dependent methyltransferase [Spirochaetota bacterium]